MIFWDWLNSNSGAVNAILVAILVVITGIYAYQTHRQVRESKAYRAIPAAKTTSQLRITVL